MFGWALLWRMPELFLLTNAGFKCCSFGCISSVCWAYFSEVMVSPGFKKLQWIRQAANHKRVTMTVFCFLCFFWCKFGCGKWFGVSSWSIQWAGCHWWSCKIHFSSYITIWLRNYSLLLHRIREENTSKYQYFLICSQFMRYPVIKLLTFPICFKCQWP